MFKTFSALGALAFITLMLIFGHTSYEATTTPSLLQQLDSVVSITGDDGTYCSGWVKKGTHEIVTAAHCSKGDGTETLHVDFGDGKKHPFHIRKKGDENFGSAPDLMTLTTNDRTINWPGGFDVCPFSPTYGEELVVMGGPLGRSKSVSFGHVGNPVVSLTDITGPKKYAQGFVLFDGQILPGNSGGPAVDVLYQCVIGSAELVQPASPLSDVPYGLSFLTPISDLVAIEND